MTILSTIPYACLKAVFADVAKNAGKAENNPYEISSDWNISQLLRHEILFAYY